MAHQIACSEISFTDGSSVWVFTDEPMTQVLGDLATRAGIPDHDRLPVARALAPVIDFSDGNDAARVSA